MVAQVVAVRAAVPVVARVPAQALVAAMVLAVANVPARATPVLWDRVHPTRCRPIRHRPAQAAARDSLSNIS